MPLTLLLVRALTEDVCILLPARFRASFHFPCTLGMHYLEVTGLGRSLLIIELYGAYPAHPALQGQALLHTLVLQTGQLASNHSGPQRPAATPPDTCWPRPCHLSQPLVPSGSPLWSSSHSGCHHQGVGAFGHRRHICGHLLSPLLLSLGLTSPS